MPNQFLIDTNFFLTAEAELYPNRIFPSFWEKMSEYASDGIILLHWAVLEELRKKDDVVSRWIKDVSAQSPAAIIRRPETVPQSYLEVCLWPVTCQRPHGVQPYTPEAISEFREQARADAWLCAEASDRSIPLVTREKPSNSFKKVKIPDVCAGIGVECLTFIEFFDRVGLVI